MPRREYKQNILCHKLYKCSLRSVSQGNRNKNKQIGPNQTYRKGNHKKKKKKQKPPTEREKISANDATNKDLISNFGDYKGFGDSKVQTTCTIQQQQNKHAN